MKNLAGVWRSIGLGLAVLFVLVVYAYGFQVTKVDLSETREPRRQEQLVRILRLLARPDILEYDREESQVNAPIQVPCPAGGLSLPASETSGTYMTVTPACTEPGGEITVEGFNFEPNLRGPLSFIPPSQVTLRLGEIQTDADGHFIVTVELPERSSDQVQYIRAVTHRNVGLPRISQNARDTWDKIIETVFLALLATTVGTLLSIPISFFAAQNLMRSIRMPIISLALSLLLFPMGLAVGAAAAQWTNQLSELLTANIAMSVSGLVVSPLVAWSVTRWALPPEETLSPGPGLRLARLAALVVAILAGLLALHLLSHLAMSSGTALASGLGGLGFLGAFVRDLGDILGTVLVPATAAGGAGVAVSLGGRLGQQLTERAAPALLKGLNVLTLTAAGALVAVGLGAGLDWLYQFREPAVTLYGPVAIGGVIGLALAVILPHKGSLPIGYVVYYVTRTVLNALRSVEALVMAIVFVVWVGIGPFAGTLALALHTVAALSKLYSEQVESILAGPLEAVQATGATRLQTVIYAVIPQIVPPYISFTMYRWDINVRMSTIIGFVGGGGIGFLLQQNINLLNYRAASAQMLAIAIVVASMDFLSAKLRERAV